MSVTASNSKRSVLGQALVACMLFALAIWFWFLQSTTWPSLSQSIQAKIAAGTTVLLFIILVAVVFRPRRTRALNASSSSEPLRWHVFHASQTGFAIELASRTAKMIEQSGQAIQLHALSDFSAEQFADTRCLFVVSTTGEGDAPDPVIAFVQQIMRQPAALQGLEYGVLALGDRSYAQFCAFGHRLDAWLAASGALPLFNLIEVDNADDAALRLWQTQIGGLTRQQENHAFERAPALEFTLASRTLANPGSSGGAVYEIHLTPNGENIQWRTGDIAEIMPMTADGKTGPQREYSIASLPSENKLSLLVRLMHDDEGTLGIGSGWLCVHTQVGSRIALRIRSNPNFHTPADDRPLILIGNGTGIAGLRAHLKARVEVGNTRNWLLFGERNQANDRFYESELDTWLESGDLAHLDRVFSREGHAHRYVQDALAAHGKRLQEWIEDGAVILVCGSQDGMAPGVDAVLRQTLGDSNVDQLLSEGRYRRDVY